MQPVLTSCLLPRFASRERCLSMPHFCSFFLFCKFVLSCKISSIAGHTRETSKDVDLSFNGTERVQTSQILPPSDSYQPKSTGPNSDYRQHSEQPAAQIPELAPSPRESVTSTPPRSTCHAPISPPLSKDATPPRISAIPALPLCPTSGSGTSTAQCLDVKSSSPPPNLSEAPSRLSSSPVGVQGFRLEMPPAGPDRISPEKLSTHPSATAAGLPMPHPPPALFSASLQRSNTQLMTTQHDKPAVPSLSPISSAGLKSLSAGADPALISITTTSSIGSRTHESMSTNPPHTYAPPAVSSHLCHSPAASLPTVAVTSAAPESPTAHPLSVLPLPTTQASQTAPVSAPHGFLSAPPTSRAFLGALQSSNTEQSSPHAVLPQASRISSPEISQASVPFQQVQAGVEEQQAKSGLLSESEYSVLDHTPVRKSPHFHKVKPSADEESFNNSSQYEGFPSFATSSRTDASSVLDNSSLIHDGGSGPDQSPDSANSLHVRRQTPQHDRTLLTEQEASTDMDTTRESSFSLEASRNDTLDSTKEGKVSEIQRTLDSLESTGSSILDSPPSSFLQIQHSSVVSDDFSDSHSFVSPEPSHKGRI